MMPQPQAVVQEAVAVEKALPAGKPEPSEFEKVLASVLRNAGTTSSPFIPVQLCENFVEILDDKAGKRIISYEDFKAMIDRSLSTTETVMDIRGSMLPSNVFFLSQSKSNMYLNCYYPGGNRTMIFGDKTMEIAAPNIVISHILKMDGSDWLVQSSKFMCTDLPISKLPKKFIESHSGQDGLYLLPMSNTYAEGNMCYGGNHMPARFKDNNLRGLDWYYRFLWETPFNSDLGIKAIRDSRGVSEWYNHLEKEAKAGRPFPYKELHNYKAPT
jgi:hypothetical protein